MGDFLLTKVGFIPGASICLKIYTDAMSFSEDLCVTYC